MLLSGLGFHASVTTALSASRAVMHRNTIARRRRRPIRQAFVVAGKI